MAYGFGPGLEGKVVNIGRGTLEELSRELDWTPENLNWVLSLQAYFGNPGGMGLGEQTPRVTPSVEKELKKLEKFMKKSGREAAIRKALVQINTARL